MMAKVGCKVHQVEKYFLQQKKESTLLPKKIFFLRSSHQDVSRTQFDAVRTTRQRLCEGAAPIIDGILSGRLLDTCLTLEMHYNRVKFLRYELLVKGGQLG